MGEFEKKNQNLLLKKKKIIKNKHLKFVKIIKYVKQNSYTILYKKCVCVDFAILFLLYYYCFPPKIFGNAKFVNKKKTFVNKQLKFEKVNKFVETTIYITYFL